MLQKNKRTGQNKLWKNFTDSVNNSIILRFIFFLSNVLYKNIGSSISAFILTGYEKYQAYYTRSLFYNIFCGGKDGRFGKSMQKVKKNIIIKCENGKIINFILNLADKILTVGLRSVGMLILSFGFYSTIIYLLKTLILNQFEITASGVFVGIAIVIISIPLIFSKQRLYDALKNSVIMNAVIFRFMGFAEKSFDGNKKNYNGDDFKTANIIAYSLGMVLGLATYFISPLLLCTLIFAVLYLYLLLCKPEIGILTLFLILPFAPTIPLAGFGILVGVSYFAKLIRGKRTFSFELFDLIVLMFCAVIFFSGVVSVSRTGSIRPALIYTCFALIYFIAVNMIRSREMIIKSIACLILSGFATALYGVYQNYFGIGDTRWQDGEMFATITGRVYSTFENPNVLAEYLILIIPFGIIWLFISAKTFHRLTSLAYLICTLLCLIFTWSRGSWLGFVFSAAILFIILNKKSIAFYIGFLFIIPLLPLVLPENVVQRFLSIGNLVDSSTSYRVSIWIASFEMIKNFFLSGIGVGIEAFKMAYPEYSLAGIESAPHSHSLYLQVCVESGILGLLLLILIIFFFLQYCFTGIIKTTEKYLKLFIAAGMCGTAGFFLNGFTDFVWYNYRVYFMFWLVVSLTIAMCRFSLKNQSSNENLYGR